MRYRRMVLSRSDSMNRVWHRAAEVGSMGKTLDAKFRQPAYFAAMNAPPDPVLIVAGPTASGKSACALAAAEEFNGVVINADSMQVYAELRILTARPGEADEARVPHRLFGVLSAAEACSAGRWLKMASAEIESAWDAGRLPIVCGGTGLYIKALTEGLSEIPEIPEAVRAQAGALYERLGGEAFRDELAALDEAAAASLPAGDRQRLTRAWEVVTHTGATMASWQAKGGVSPFAARFAGITLTPPRQDLHAACEARFERMLTDGALGEVRALLDLGLDPGLPAMKALGLAELAAHLRGEISLDEAAEKAKTATRRYAKRQNTWIRTQMGGAGVLAAVFSAKYSESIREEIFSFIRQFLLTTRR